MNTMIWQSQCQEAPSVRYTRTQATNAGQRDSVRTLGGSRRTWWVAQALILVCWACVLPSAWGQGPVSKTQGSELSSQRSEIEELKAKVKQLEQSVEHLKKNDEEDDKERSLIRSILQVPAIDRERGLVTEDAYGDPRLDNAPFDPALRGFFRLPGTHTKMRIGGYIRTDAIYDFHQLGNVHQFRPESIPVPNFDTSNFDMTARTSRISMETRSDLGANILRTYMEFDFVGPGNSTNYRLRHFYGQWKNILVGQAWSLFHDSDVIPDTVDFNGPNSWIFQFNPQVRYTQPLADGHTVAVAVEQPSSSVPTIHPLTNQPISSTSPLPDFVVRYRYETDDYHLNTAGLFRSVGGVTSAGQSDHTFGYGVMASGLFRLSGRDNFVFQAVYGEGISRYFTDTKNLDLDAGYDSSGQLKAQPVYGGYAALQHFWNDKWRSTVTYGYLQVSTSEMSSASIYKRTQYVDCNLMYSPAEGIAIGGGLVWGQRVNKDDEMGDGFRLNFLLKYDLVRLQQDVKRVIQ